MLLTMKIRTLFGWLFQATKWVLTIVGYLVLVLLRLFLFYTFAPYLGQSEHGNQVQAKYPSYGKPVAKNSPLRWWLTSTHATKLKPVESCSIV